MASNAVISLLGNCTQPEAKVMPDGTEVVNFSIAVNEWSKDGDTTSWYRVSVWGNRCKGLITLMNKDMFTKGMLVSVVGKLSQRAYTAADGTSRVSMDVRAYDADICFPPKAQQDSQADYMSQEDLDKLPF